MPSSGTISQIKLPNGNIYDLDSNLEHAHGNITHDGKLQTSDITIANGDKLVVTDASDTSKIARASVAFDGSTTTKFLSKKGTWEDAAHDVQVNGTSVLSGGVANITVPTKTSELNNDSNFTTASGHNHDSRYYTETEIDTALSGKADSTHTHTKSQITDFPSLLALGETSSTAYRGDRGKTAYDHSQTAHAPSNAEQNVQSNWTETDTSSDAYIKNKPSTFTPSAHTHDDRYYTESETNNLLSGKCDLVDGKIVASQLPSYVDDVLSYNSQTDFPATGEDGKIYIAKDTNKTYRWTGTGYAEISESLALGETSATAYRGDRGKIAYDHSQTSHAPANAEANQNAFSNITVGSTTIAADSKTDTFTLTAGSNVTLTPDATNDKITIAATDTTYSSKSAASGGTAVSLVTTGEKYTWNNKGTYSKPSDGIPKTDLASGVQTSLGKADTALQSHQDISGKENTSNKVTSWSTTTTDTHYPSEKLVKTALDGKADSSHTQAASTITGLATVATSGSYSDLSNKPTIPTKTSQLTNDSGFITSAPVTSVAGKTGAVTLSKSDVGLGNVGNFKAVSTVASQGLTSTEQSNARANIGAGTSSFSGSYNDLSNKPTIPTVNNATLTIQKNGTSVGTFTANASSNVTANITVPTTLADLSEDATHRLVTDTEKALWNSKTKITIKRWENDD